MRSSIELTRLIHCVYTLKNNAYKQGLSGGGVVVVG